MQSAQNQEKAEVKDNTYRNCKPGDGTIEQFSGLYRGSSVQTGQSICGVSPDSTIYVEAYVSPNDSGYISVGMPVKVQITSFNYNEWGTVMGSVIYVSSDYMSDEKGNTYFKVKCKLQQKVSRHEENWHERIPQKRNGGKCETQPSAPV